MQNAFPIPLSSPLTSLSHGQSRSSEPAASMSDDSETNDRVDIPSFYNSHLEKLFAIDLRCTDESEWYGPWNYLLMSLFRVEEGFHVAPHHTRGREPDSTFYYLVKTFERLITCVVEIKPGYHYDIPTERLDAYKQLKKRLQRCLIPDVRQNVQTVYGLSCIGDRFMVMKMDTASGNVLPKLNAGKPVDNVAPVDWWRHRTLRLQGCRRLLELVEDVKASLSEQVQYASPAVPIILAEDESDKEKSDDDEQRKRKRKRKRKAMSEKRMKINTVSSFG